MHTRLLSFDIDNTLLENPELPSPFNKVWKRILQNGHDTNPLLCLNTGRMLDDTLGLISAKILPEPDFLICGVGTTIYDVAKKEKLKEFSEILEEGWDKEKVKEIIESFSYPITPQPAPFSTCLQVELVFCKCHFRRNSPH